MHDCFLRLPVTSQRQVIPHFCLCQFSKSSGLPVTRFLLHLLSRRDCHYSNLDRLFCHLPLKALFECKQSGMNGIFER